MKLMLMLVYTFVALSTLANAAATPQVFSNIFWRGQDHSALSREHTD